MNEFKRVVLEDSDTLIKVRVTCVNTGTSDAHLVDFGVDFFLVKPFDELPMNPDWKIRGTFNDTKLPSGVSAPWPDFEHILPANEAHSVRMTDARLYFAGYIHYQDGLGNVRTTAFCRVLRVLEPARFIPPKYPDPDYEYQD